MFQQKPEEILKTLAIEMLKRKSLGTDIALVHARECFEQSSTPLVDMSESYVTFKRMDLSRHKIYALLWIRKSRFEHFASQDLSAFVGLLFLDVIDVLLNDLKFLRSHCEPASVYRASYIVN